MVVFRRFVSIFSLNSLDSDVMVSQITAFSRQVPLLYVIGNANSLALAYTHYDCAPKLLTLIVPIPMFVICLVRIVVWMRSTQTTFTPESARARLRSLIQITVALGTIYAAWALCLYPYGDAYARCHVAFFMSMTVIGTIFCLMHLRQAALLLTAIVGVPFVIRFTTTNEPVMTAMALNFLLVIIVMVFILLIYYRDFSNLVLSKKTLAALSDENFRLANLDSLTGLPNRRSFFRDVGALVENKPVKGRFALGMIDLDGFKPVNDVFGHAAGDHVLSEVGRRLIEALGPPNVVARLGGDEFGLIIDMSDETADIAARGDELCTILKTPIALPNGTARIGASIGFAILSSGDSTREQLIERADYALYTAKAKHKGTAVVFTDTHEDAIRVKSIVEQTLRKADFAAEMTMKFQPIVDTALDKIVAFEALARWHSPVLGPVPPLDFIEAAERCGVISDLTPILFAKSLEALRTWPEDMGLSFNLSVNDIASAHFLATVRHMLETSGIGVARIAFEITETALMHDFEQARQTLLDLKELGAKIALDDFGTGYSSLHYVHRLPLDRIKIDRGFITDIASNLTSRKIVKSIIDLCFSLEITCVVEGVETPEQVFVLRALGCDTMQGYLFGRPADNETLRFFDKPGDRVGTPVLARDGVLSPTG